MTTFLKAIGKEINESILVKQNLGQKIVKNVSLLVEQTVCALQKGHKVIVFGNGGSAADAQHIAAELLGRFALDRTPYKAMALTTNSSVITAVGNDYGFETIFERQIQAWAEPGDIIIGISTSGNSENVLKGLQAAKAKKAYAVALTGKDGGKAAKLCDLLIAVPSTNTPRIQECHTMLGHIYCQLVESELCGSS